MVIGIEPKYLYPGLCAPGNIGATVTIPTRWNADYRRGPGAPIPGSQNPVNPDLEVPVSWLMRAVRALVILATLSFSVWVLLVEPNPVNIRMLFGLLVLLMLGLEVQGWIRDTKVADVESLLAWEIRRLKNLESALGGLVDED